MSKRKPRKPRIALMYDFDGTLSPRNMQEYDFIPALGITPTEFWKDANDWAKQQKADGILAYMCLMLKKAHAKEVKITKKDIQGYGKSIELFPGVLEWFDRLDVYADDHGFKLEHYIISSGLREMVEGTPIASKFEKIFASSFMYDIHNVATWPGMAVNYTTKTQFVFRINKGISDVSDNTSINAFMAKEDRPVPFNRMMYFGDGETDVPCMKLVKAQGGYSIAVYKPDSRKKKTVAKELLSEDRVSFIAPADYSEDTELDKLVKSLIRKMAADFDVDQYRESRRPRRATPEPSEQPETASVTESGNGDAVSGKTPISTNVENGKNPEIRAEEIPW